MVPVPYNHNLQIVQTSGAVLILNGLNSFALFAAMWAILRRVSGPQLALAGAAMLALLLDRHITRNYIESITGFQFAIGEPTPAINPSKRMGWAFGGPGFSQLQQFFY